MKIFDLYGLEDDDLEAARVAVEQVLGIHLIPHESLHRGDYYRGRIGKEEFVLERNFDPFYEEVVENDFPEMRVLLYVDYINVANTERPKEIEQMLTGRIPGLKLLRRTTFT